MNTRKLADYLYIYAISSYATGQPRPTLPCTLHARARRLDRRVENVYHTNIWVCLLIPPTVRLPNAVPIHVKKRQSSMLVHSATEQKPPQKTAQPPPMISNAKEMNKQVQPKGLANPNRSHLPTPFFLPPQTNARFQICPTHKSKKANANKHPVLHRPPFLPNFILLSRTGYQNKQKKSGKISIRVPQGCTPPSGHTCSTDGSSTAATLRPPPHVLPQQAPGSSPTQRSGTPYSASPARQPSPPAYPPPRGTHGP